MSLVATARAAIDEAAAHIVELSHYIHAHPELGYEEFKSAEACAATLEAAGFAVERGIANLPTAFRAVAGSGAFHVVYCAEYDALPDVGHACGHNIIAGASVGAAIGLAAVASALDLTVTVLGTPSEEGGGGKIDLLNAGYFTSEHVAMMVHPWPAERLTGACLAVDQFDVTYHGKEAHASAAPWQGVNALDGLTVAQVALGLLRQQFTPGDQVHLVIIEGGTAANIIPHRVVARVMVRATTIERLHVLRERVNRCFEAGALAAGATMTMATIGHTFSHMEADTAILAHYRQVAEALGRDFSLDDEQAPLPTFSTDMANISLALPSIHPLVRIETDGAVNHQPAFTAACITAGADRVLLESAVALAQTAILVAQDAPLRARLMART